MDINQAAQYAGYAKKLSSIGGGASKLIGSETGQQAFSGLGKGASSLLSAYSAYRIAKGQGTVGDYASVGSVASKLSGIGKSVVPYAGAALGLYNIVKNKEVNAGDVMGLSPALLNAGAAGAQALGAGTVGTASAAGTGAAGGLGAAGAAAGTAAIGYAAAKLGGMAAGAMNDKWFNNKAVPLQHLEGSLSEPLAVEKYWANQLGEKGIGNAKVNQALMQDFNPLAVGQYTDALGKLGKGKSESIEGMTSILSGGITSGIKNLFGGGSNKSKTTLRLEAQYKALKKAGMLDEQALGMGKRQWVSNVKTDIRNYKQALGDKKKDFKIDWKSPIMNQLGDTYGKGEYYDVKQLDNIGAWIPT